MVWPNAETMRFPKGWVGNLSAEEEKGSRTEKEMAGPRGANPAMLAGGMAHRVSPHRVSLKGLEKFLGPTGPARPIMPVRSAGTAE